MVLVRPTTIMAMLKRELPPRNVLPFYGLQIVEKGDVWWAEKAAWFRNVPWRAISPTLGQLETRVRFAVLAKEAKARGLTGTKDKPAVSARLGRAFVGAAAYIADNMVGWRAPHRLEPERYPSRIRRTWATAAEREVELKSEYARRRETVPPELTLPPT
jgi:hypothetical protein